MMNAPQFGAVAGLIGAGKTTLMEDMCEAATGNATPLWESLEGVEEFYKDPKLHAFPLQVQLLMQRLEHHQLVATSGEGENAKGAHHLFLMDRSLYEDRAFAAMLCQPSHFEVYDSLLERMLVREGVQHPNWILFLEVSPETALRRIQDRNRSCETGITLEYLQRLEEFYHSHFLPWVEERWHIPVIRLPWDQDKTQEESKAQAKELYTLMTAGRNHFT